MKREEKKKEKRKERKEERKDKISVERINGDRRTKRINFDWNFVSLSIPLFDAR